MTLRQWEDRPTKGDLKKRLSTLLPATTANKLKAIHMIIKKSLRLYVFLAYARLLSIGAIATWINQPILVRLLSSYLGEFIGS